MEMYLPCGAESAKYVCPEKLISILLDHISQVNLKNFPVFIALNSNFS